MKKIRELLKQIPILRKVVILVNNNISKFMDNDSYYNIRIRLEKLDKKNSNERKELKPLHKKLNSLRREQSTSWNSMIYCDGYFYQGYNRIGISGIKPTEHRIQSYEINKYLTKKQSVLDIGTNSGFLACYISDFVKDVDGIELNPYLNEMGKETSKFLKISNTDFIEGDFINHTFTKKYEIIFSLSNHFTIDGNLNIGFELYIQKIFNVMNNDGILFFESHDIKGDDNDLDLKFQIASKYFDLVEHKMVKAFYPADIDKLFAVFKKLDNPGEIQKNKFNLNKAKMKYKY